MWTGMLQVRPFSACVRVHSSGLSTAMSDAGDVSHVFPRVATIAMVMTAMRIVHSREPEKTGWAGDPVAEGVAGRVAALARLMATERRGNACDVSVLNPASSARK